MVVRSACPLIYHVYIIHTFRVSDGLGADKWVARSGLMSLRWAARSGMCDRVYVLGLIERQCLELPAVGLPVPVQCKVYYSS